MRFRRSKIRLHSFRVREKQNLRGLVRRACARTIPRRLMRYAGRKTRSAGSSLRLRGTGKTLLARATVSMLPDLSEEEMIEVTTIHSLAGTLRGSVMFRPPFRSPHHTSSYASLIGGGSSGIRPGEATLAHRGVL